MSERKQHNLIWRMIRKYQMPDGYAFLALTLLKFNGLMSAARYCWHYRYGAELAEVAEPDEQDPLGVRGGAT